MNSVRCLNDPDHQKQPQSSTVFTFREGDGALFLSLIEPSEGSRKNKPNPSADNKNDLHLPIYLPVQPLCPTSCPEVCLWWDDLSIFFMEKEKHVDLWEEAWAFRRFYTSFYYSGDLLAELTGRGRGFKRPRLTLYISPPTWSGQEPRHREGWALLWLIDVPNKE